MKTRSSGPPEEVKAKGRKGKAKNQKKRGRKKEKVQISVRLDKAVMDIAYDRIRESGDRITDLLERGLILALREKGDLPPVALRARFVVANLDAEFQRHVVWLGKLWVMPQVRELAPLEKHFRDFFLGCNSTVDGWEDSPKAEALLSQPREPEQAES